MARVWIFHKVSLPIHVSRPKALKYHEGQFSRGNKGGRTLKVEFLKCDCQPNHKNFHKSGRSMAGLLAGLDQGKRDGT
jgi:hypothetical protein